MTFRLHHWQLESFIRGFCDVAAPEAELVKGKFVKLIISVAIPVLLSVPVAVRL